MKAEALMKLIDTEAIKLRKEAGRSYPGPCESSQIKAVVNVIASMLRPRDKTCACAVGDSNEELHAKLHEANNKLHVANMKLEVAEKMHREAFHVCNMPDWSTEKLKTIVEAWEDLK